MRLKVLALFTLFISLCFSSFTFAAAKTYNILDFGAVADGKTINTKAIQTAIDKCSAAGGGTVLIPAGTFLSGTLHLKNDVTLHLVKQAVLLGSPSFDDYPDNEVKFKNGFTYNDDGKPYPNKAFLFAEAVHNITIDGEGLIDGNGKSKEFDLGNDGMSAKSRSRPCMILFVDCQKIKLDGVKLMNSAYWLQNYLGCDGLTLRNLTIYNHANWNVDGMDIDSKNVLVENCKLDVDDDGICLKSHDRARICENVTIRNCDVASNCSPLKFGTAGIGGFKNINISDCTIHKASEDRIRHWQKNVKFVDEPITGLAGIGLECVDGGVIDDVTIKNIKMEDIQTPIFIVLGNRGRKPIGFTGVSPVAQIKNISISNILATSHSKMSSSITAFPGYYVENVKLSNILLNDMGGGTVEEGNKELPESPKGYPENRMYAQVYPASGLFVRHVKGLTLDKVELALVHPDARPAIILDDVIGANIKELKAAAPSENTAVIKIVKSKQVAISNSAAQPKGNPFTQLTDTDKQEVVVKD